MDVLVQLILQVTLIPVGFLFGGSAERRHLKALDEREAARTALVTNQKRVVQPERVQSSFMVMGQTVVATDYYKSFVAKLKSLVGGELKSAQTLMVRARREALARMVEQAESVGASEVWNVRFETSSISRMTGKGGSMQVEVVAWGTAVVRKAG